MDSKLSPPPCTDLIDDAMRVLRDLPLPAQVAAARAILAWGEPCHDDI